MRPRVVFASIVAGASAIAALAGVACSKDDATASAPSDAGGDAEAATEEDAGPSWLGDAGLLARKPVERPLHELCGIASNPGDMPLGEGARETALRKGYFDAAIDLGGVMIRRDFRWSEIEPERGRYVFEPHDRLVGEASARGVRLLGTLDYGVPWANAATQGGRDTFPPTNPDDFAAFAGAVAQRFRGKVAAWEIWNEPNNGWRFWEPELSGDPAAYGLLLERASGAIRSASPGTPVLLGGTVFTPQLIEGAITWLERMYAARPEAARAFDVAGIHTYAQYPPERPPEIGEVVDPPLEAKIQMHAWLLDKQGAGDTPIWITEIGWPVWASVDRAGQARLTVRATILAAHAGASGIFWYTLRDGPHPTAFPPEDAFGLLGNDVDVDAGREAAPKPVYVALKALLATVGERWATTDAAPVSGLPADGHAVVFRGASGGDVAAVWTVTTAQADVRLDRGAADVVDQMGAPRGSIATGASFAIGPDVTYLRMK